MRKENTLPVQFSPTSYNGLQTSQDPGSIPGGGTTVAPTGCAGLFLIKKDA